MTSPLCLFQKDGAVLLGRVLQSKAASPWRIETAGSPTAQVYKIDKKFVVMQLGLLAEDWRQAENVLHDAQRQVAAEDVEQVWLLLESQASGLGEVTQLLLGKSDLASRQTVALVLGVADDGFYLDQTGLQRRDATARQAHSLARTLKQAADQQIAPWLLAIDALRLTGTGDKLALQQAGDRLLAWIGRPQVTDLAVEQFLVQRGRHHAAQPRDAADLLSEMQVWDGHEDLELWRSGVLQPFAPDALACLQVAPELPDTELDYPFVTIDNDAPHEVDDAIYAEEVADGTRIWLAIAAPTAWVRAGDALDLAAQHRGSTLYHPRHTVPMLPDELARDAASLTVDKWRPALVFAATVAPDGRLLDQTLQEARIRVGFAWSYRRLESVLAGQQAADEIDLPLVQRLIEACNRAEHERIRNGAFLLYKPDVDVSAPAHGEVVITPASQMSPPRRMITEAMVICGQIAASYARENAVALPYRAQPKPQHPSRPPGLYSDPADVYAVFRSLAPARFSVQPQEHGVIGVPAYVQVTSPLRRYGDLLAQRQLLAALRHQPRPHTGAEIEAIMRHTDDAQALRRQIQRRGDRYFKLVWLAQRGIGTTLLGQIVRPLQQRGQMLLYVPDLGLEVALHAPAHPPGTWLTVAVRSVHPGQGELAVSIA